MTADDGWVFDDDTIGVAESDVAFVVDVEQTVVYATDQFVERVGRPQAELVGTACETVTDWLGSDTAELLSAIESVLCGTVSHARVEVAVAGTDAAAGEQLWEAQVTPVLAGGELRGALVVCRGEETVSERLAEAHQRYRTLVERNRDGVTITRDGKNVFVNNRFAEMVGYAKSELEGESFLVPIAPKDRELVEERHEKRLQGETPPRRYELTLQTKSGEELVVELNVAAIQYGGEPAVMATYRDVTERKERERELRRFRRAIETAPQAIALTDEEGTINYVNPAFEGITGYSSEEALGETPSLFHSEETPDSLHGEMLETITGGEVWEGYLINRCADGDLYHARETVAPIMGDDGQRHGYVGIHMDVSEQIEREQLISGLDRVLRHNLRNRLNVIEAHANLVATGHDVDEHVERILDSVEALLDTTQKGREIITFLSHPSQNRPKDAVETVRNAVQNVPGAGDATITLETPEQAYVSAVRELDTAVEELVRNAIEHSDRDEPEVSVTVHVEAEHVEIRVADDGPGVSEMEREILDETRDIDQLYHGSGFGLWLVYWIVRQSGGHVRIADRSPRGTVVTIELDRATNAGTESTIDSLLSARTQQ